jgi:Ser/Thr protein kinase RdoA (MazF antagonist)
MTGDLTNSVATAVLNRFLADKQLRLIALGNRGGFSGARLWRVECSQGAFCLKAWPQSGPSPKRLVWIHQLMRRACAATLGFVPAPQAIENGSSCIYEQGRLWDLTTWMPGRADFHAKPTAGRLEAACTALAELHAVWAGAASQTAACPAIERRLGRWREWQSLVKSGWQPALDQTPDQALRAWAGRAWNCLSRAMDELHALLAPWADRPVRLQPCLCDIWHDHVLFDEERVTGLIDFGAVKVDHVAVDLARLLGSMAGNDRGLCAAGLGAYARKRSLSVEDEILVDVLDQSGTLIGLANWLEWIYREKRAFEDNQAVATRLGELVVRVEGSCTGMVGSRKT